MVFDFEDPGELDAFAVNHPGNVALHPEPGWAASGRHSMRAAYAPSYNWPAVQFIRPAPDAAPPYPGLSRFFTLLDSGEYDTIVMVLRNPQDREIMLNVNRTPFKLPPDSVTPLEISIAQLAERCAGDIREIQTVNITGFPEQGDFSIYFDAIGLQKTPDNRPHFAAMTARKASERARELGADRFVLGVESPMRHVYLEPARYEPAFQDQVDLCAARNEWESFQLVVVPVAGDLENVHWRIEGPTNVDGTALPVSIRRVGYVHTDPVFYVLNANGGWYPDLLFDAANIEHVPADRFANLWVKVRVPADATPGTYHGTVTVLADDAAPQELPLSVEVWPFTLPTRPALKQALSLNDRSNFHFYDTVYPGDRIAALRTRFENLLLGEYRMDINTLYGVTPPLHWDAARLRELDAMGLPGILLGHFDTHPESYPGMNPNLDERMDEIEAYLKVVEEAGLRHLCYFYGYDEAETEEMEHMFRTAAALKERFPDIPFLTTATAYHHLDGALLPGAEAVDWWCHISSAPFWYPPAKRGQLERVREAGFGIWWYICNMSGAPEPNFDVELSPVEPRILLGALAHKYEVMGFLYYALNYWGNNALPVDPAEAPYTAWKPDGILVPERYNGQGILVVPGPDGPIPTIRMEMYRDGLEDYDTYALLKAMGPEGERLARVPEHVVHNGWVHTTDPAVMQQERLRLAQAIMKLQGSGTPPKVHAPCFKGGTARPELRVQAPPNGSAASRPGLHAVPLSTDATYTLRIELDGYNRLLNLGEIEVYRGTENLALLGTASMSSQNPTWDSSYLNNGIASGTTRLDPKDLAHSYWSLNPWAEIRLPPTDRIDRIVVWNRAVDCEDCNTRLLPFTLTLRDGAGRLLWSRQVRNTRIQTRDEDRAGDRRFQKIVVE